MDGEGWMDCYVIFVIESWLISDIHVVMFISGAGQALDGVICMALSSKPRYAELLCNFRDIVVYWILGISAIVESWLISDIHVVMFISGAGQALDGVICMALSSKPRYAAFVFDIKMYGSMSLMCIFDIIVG